MCVMTRKTSHAGSSVARYDDMVPLADAAGGTRRTMLTTLATPPGVAKSLPLVVHTEGNTMYEEPCVYYLSLRITQVHALARQAAGQTVCSPDLSAAAKSFHGVVRNQ